MLAAAALHGCTDPDLLDEVAWWQADNFWKYALFAAVAYIRAAASRAGRAGTPGMPGPGPAPRAPSAITTSSGRRASGHLTVGRPIITAGTGRGPVPMARSPSVISGCDVDLDVSGSKPENLLMEAH